MKFKTYYAADMPEALKQIKSELGPDAMIVQSRKVRHGGLRGYFRKPVLEVQAAIDTDTAFLSSHLATGASAIAAVSRPRHDSDPTNFISSHEIREDLAELKQAVKKLTNRAQFNLASQAPVLNAIYQILVSQEVEDSLAQNLVLAANRELSAQALQDVVAIRDAIVRNICQSLPANGPISITSARPRTVFLVGPTGVGKTTTIAKIAAEFALIQRKRVVLVTTDTFRVAAIPQLETYARIIGIPIDVVYRPEELAGVIASHADKDLILVDTPGRSQRNVEHLQELGKFVDAVKDKDVYLAISSATKYKDMLDIAEKFSILNYSGILITKTDETDCFGPLLSLITKLKKPLTYLTTGQNVPNDIEVATPMKLASLAFKGGMEGVLH